MPAIRGCYEVNPKTGVAGIWIEPSGSPPGTYIGVSQTTINALKPSGGITVAKAATFGTALKTAIQSEINTKHPFGIGAVKVQIKITSLSPLRYEVELSNP